MKFGIDRLLAEPDLRRPLAGKRVALLAHPASVTADLTHSLDALAASGTSTLTAAFGPQHGLRGDKQDNMVESGRLHRPGPRHSGVQPLWRGAPPDRRDDGQLRRAAGRSAGPRLPHLHLHHDPALRARSGGEHGKAVWVLDRPNPVGRPVEGLTLRPGWESFVGAGPMPMRHGLTMGEMGALVRQTFKLDVDYRVIEMEGWAPDAGPGLRLAAGRAHLGQPQPQCAQPVDGALLRRHGDGRGHDAVRRPRHDPAAGAVRRARYRRPQGVGADAGAGPAMAGRLPPARRAGSSRPSTSMPASCATACRSTPRTRPTTTTPSGPGGCRRWPSRRSGGCTRTTPCGAISPTSTSTASWPST